MAGKLHHRCLSFIYHPLRYAKSVGRVLHISRINRLRTLLYHDVPPSEHRRFAKQLEWLAKRWRFVTPTQFSDMVTGITPVHGSCLLLTFDDGYASNRAVAEDVLEPMGIRALFFVVSDFIALAGRQQAREFIARRILPGSQAATLPTHLGSMNWRDLEYLLERGHTIGGHTKTHARLSDIESVAGLQDEIFGGADIIERKLAIRIEHFAYTFGGIASISPEALAICRQRFRFIHSGLRGDNAGGAPLFALRRDAVTSSDPNSLLGAFLEGGADFHYASPCAELESWA